jgi:hypothetical protein
MDAVDRLPAPAAETHKHSCGHYDACHSREADDCRECRRIKFRERVASETTQ